MQWTRNFFISERQSFQVNIIDETVSIAGHNCISENNDNSNPPSFTSAEYAEMDINSIMNGNVCRMPIDFDFSIAAKPSHRQYL